MKRPLFCALIFSLTCGLFYGCASYHFGRGTRALPGGYDRLAVPMFINKTQEVGIETYFTEELRTQFERSRVAKVTSVNDAQLILKGTIKTLSYVPTVIVTYGTTQLLSPNPAPYPNAQASPAPSPNSNPLPSTATLAKQYAVNLVVHIEAHRASDDVTVWSSDFTGATNYQAPLLGTPTSFLGPGKSSSSPPYNENSRQDTIASMAKNMMAEAHDRLTENF